MAKMTPEQLWRDIDAAPTMSDGGGLIVLERREALAAASAWEADQRHMDELAETGMNLDLENAELKERIEALMQANAKAAILRGEDLERIEALETREAARLEPRIGASSTRGW